MPPLNCGYLHPNQLRWAVKVLTITSDLEILKPKLDVGPTDFFFLDDQ